MLKPDEIRLAERAHYSMQLSAYFSELVDLPGVRFAFADKLTDTWYNQAYDVDWRNRDLAQLGRTVQTMCESRRRAPCIYLSPASLPETTERYIEDKLGLVRFEEEAWMFHSSEPSSPRKNSSSTRVHIVEATLDEHFPDFVHVYRHGLPGPEVEAYIAAVTDGLRYAPATVDVHYLLAYLGDDPAGMLSILSTNGCSGIYAVATLEPFRQQGVARALVEAGLAIADANASRYVFLQTVAGEESEETFQHMGFETLFTRPGYTTTEIAEGIEHG